MMTMGMSTGILAYGSLIDDPHPNSAQHFPRFGRMFPRRSMWSTLGPVESGTALDAGGQVSAALLVLRPEVTISQASDMLYRREIGRVGSSATYEPVGIGRNRVEVVRLDSMLGVATVLTPESQAIGQAAILQGHKVLYRETHLLLEELADATLDGARKPYMESVSTVALLIIDDFGMRKLPQTAAEDLLEIVMRRYERASTLLTSNRPVEDWGKLLGDVAAVSAMLDRLLHHGHVLKCGPKSWRTKTAAAG